MTDSCGSGAAAVCFTGTSDTPGVIPTDPRIGITPNLGANREGVPFISISGGFTLGNNFEGELPQIGNTYQFSDNLTKVMGNHTTKFGVDFRNQRFLQTLYFDVNGDFSYFGGGPNDPIASMPTGIRIFSPTTCWVFRTLTCKDRRRPRTSAATQSTCSRRIAGRSNPT